MTVTNYIKGQNPLTASQLNTDFGRCLDKSGDVMTGLLTLASDPGSPLQAATKQYVDNKIATSIAGAQGPPGPPGGMQVLIGGWNASTNTPTLASGALASGVVVPSNNYYIVTTGGTTPSIDGNTTWVAGDYAVSNGTVWMRVLSSGVGYLPLTGGSVSGTTSIGTGSTNYIQISGAASNPQIAVAGGGTNGSLLLRAQGTGSVNIGSVNSGNVAQFVAAATNGDTLTITQPATVGAQITFDAAQAGNSGGFFFGRAVNIGRQVTLSGTMGTSPIWLTVGNNLLGTNTIQQGVLNTIGINSDKATPNGGVGSLTILDVHDKVDTGWQGSRVGINVSLSDIAATTLNSNTSLVGVSALSISQFNQGGVTTGFGATQFGSGGNFGAVFGVGLLGSATFMRGLTGVEIDVHQLAGTSSSTCVGLQIVHDGAHAVQSVNTDVAFRIADQVSATVGWKNVITLGSYDSKWPCDPNGYLLQLQYSAGTGTGAGAIDLLQFNASGSGGEGGGFAFRSGGGTLGAYAIDASGNIKIGSGYISANSAGLVIDAPLWVLSGTPTIGAGGANYAVGDVVVDGLGNVFTVATQSGGVVTSVTVRQVGEGRTSNPSGTIACTSRARSGANLGTGLTLVQTWAQSTKSIQVASTGGRLGFLGTTPVVKPTVTGAKASNAALASLITALAAYGLVIDSTTA